MPQLNFRILCVICFMLLQKNSLCAILLPADTNTIKYYDRNGKIKKEENFVAGVLVSTKRWYYGKDYFGYRLEPEPFRYSAIVERKEFFPDSTLKIAGSTIRENDTANFRPGMTTVKNNVIVILNMGKKTACRYNTSRTAF